MSVITEMEMILLVDTIKKACVVHGVLFLGLKLYCKAIQLSTAYPKIGC